MRTRHDEFMFVGGPWNWEIHRVDERNKTYLVPRQDDDDAFSMVQYEKRELFIRTERGPLFFDAFFLCGHEPTRDEAFKIADKYGILDLRKPRRFFDFNTNQFVMEFYA